MGEWYTNELWDKHSVDILLHELVSKVPGKPRFYCIETVYNLVWCGIFNDHFVLQFFPRFANMLMSIDMEIDRGYFPAP